MVGATGILFALGRFRKKHIFYALRPVHMVDESYGNVCLFQLFSCLMSRMFREFHVSPSLSDNVPDLLQSGLWCLCSRGYCSLREPHLAVRSLVRATCRRIDDTFTRTFADILIVLLFHSFSAAI